MTSVESLFELQSSAPGMPGPYLVENLAPYRFFDQIGQSKPQIRLVIGGACKRQYMSSAYLAQRYPKEHGIAIAYGGDNTLILDGELHLKDVNDLPRFQERRPFGGGYNVHILEHRVARSGSIANQIYANVLSPFSDVVLIFVPDLGLQRAIELLCCWMKSAMKSRFHVNPQIVLLHEEIPPDLEIRNRLMASLASELRRSDSIRSYTNAEIRTIMENAFCITNASLADCTWQVEKALRMARAERVDKGMDLEAHQVKHLLQGAIRQYREDPLMPFDTIRALRRQYSPDLCHSDALRDFLKNHQPISDMEAGIVASALYLDAYHPPGMPRFPPDRIFESLYQRLVGNCGDELQCATLCDHVRSHFITIAMNCPAAITLDLNGTDPVTVIQFLKDLHRSIGVPLKQCFDIVVGAGSGKSPTRPAAPWMNESDVSIRYNDTPYGQELLNHTVYSLIAALFYVELVSRPTFYTSSLQVKYTALLQRTSIGGHKDGSSLSPIDIGLDAEVFGDLLCDAGRDGDGDGGDEGGGDEDGSDEGGQDVCTDDDLLESGDLEYDPLGEEEYWGRSFELKLGGVLAREDEDPSPCAVVLGVSASSVP
ncbi:Patatin-like serine hydrolase [Fusarium austroafricanum]|uniref:Patatin-like serine hydrolase n=1 Tax=Fusarium austroafricanum TaxID=2364996 RepID=A0A8H4KDW3_9HYPO|nr:Patatin-like serine hydrolase [Fusarium austroafricanum]